MKYWFVVLLFLGFLSSHALAEARLIGKKSDDFQLRNLEGEKNRFSKFREGQGAILLFWTTWCGTCRVTISDLNKDAMKFTRQGVKFLMINLGEGEGEVRSYVKSNKIQLPVWLDKNTELMDPFGIVQVPTFVLIDREGTIRAISSRLPEGYEQLLKAQAHEAKL